MVLYCLNFNQLEGCFERRSFEDKLSCDAAKTYTDRQTLYYSQVKYMTYEINNHQTKEMNVDIAFRNAFNLS